MENIPTFGIAETDDYVRKILSRAGKLPVGNLDALHAALVPHVMHQESRGNPRAVSKKGAVGTMQTMPATLKNPGFGVTPARDDSDAERERVGKDYLRAMLARYPGRPDLALAAYNAGPGRADRWAKQSGARFMRDPDQPLFRTGAGVEGIATLSPNWGERPLATDRPRKANLFSNIVGVDSSIAAFARMAEDSAQTFDPDFELGSLNDKEWAQVTQGIPEEYWTGLAGAVSRSHLNTLSARIRAQVEAEREMAAYGGWGVAARFAYNLVGDPVGMALNFASGGVGVATKAHRLAQAAEAARTAGRLEEASAAVKALEAIARGGAWQNAGRAAAINTGASVAMEGIVDYGNPDRDGWDLAFAGLGGAVLGAGFSRVFTGNELRRVQGAFMRESALLRNAELVASIEAKRVELTAQLADLEAQRAAPVAEVEDARRALANLTEELRATAEARRLELTKTAEGALKRSELGSLRRTTEGLRRQARDAQELEPQIRERMLREDVASMGEEVATSKQRAKLRHGAAKAEAANRWSTIRANLERAETALARGQAAEDARVELRRVERQAAKGEHLWMLDEPGRNRFGERELELTKNLQRALGIEQKRNASLDARKADLEGQLKGLEEAQARGIRASDEQILRQAEAFGMDTASAARFTGFAEGVHAELDGVDSGLPSIARMGAKGARGKAVDVLTMRKGPFATFSMILRGSPNEVVRDELGRMVGNAVGNADGTPNLVGASEIHARIHESMTAKFNAAINAPYREWAERNGYGAFERWTRPVRERFMADMGLAIRKSADVTEQVTDVDPAILKAATKVRQVFAEYLKEAKAAGVKGFENVEMNEGYLPRVFDFRRVYDIEQDIGSDNLRALVAKAVQAADEEIDDKLAAAIARAYVKRMKELRVGSDVGLMQGMRWDDVGFLRRFLDEAGTPREEIDEVVNKFAALNARRERQTEGTVRYGKHRVQFDETTAMVFRSQNAAREGRIEDVEIALSDLFENNVEHLFGRYSRSMSGHIGLAKVGIKSKNDFDLSIRKVERALEGDPDELKRVKDTAEMAYKLITGQPVQDATMLTKLGRAARDFNFTTTMNQTGWAQFPDMAGLLQSGYLRYTITNFFDGFRSMRRTDGVLDDAFAKEMEEWLGVGTDFYNNAVFSSYDPGEEGGLIGALGKVEHGLRVAGRGTQAVSGMAWMTAFSQRLVARNIVQRLVKDVTEGGGFNKARAATLGLDDAMKARIERQIRKYTEFVDGNFGGKVRVVNWMKWDDVEARDAMLYATFREARRLVQEEDLGDTTKWMHTNWGKILAQFRRFALVSYSKQVMHGIAHADAEEATRVLISMVMASMAYTARHSIALASQPADKREEYAEKYLSPDRLAAAAIANSSYSTVFPALFDSTVGLAVGQRFFDTRTSGLGSDIITGNPTYSALFKNLPNAVGGASQAMLRGDRQFTQSEARAIRKLLPYQNVLGVDAAFNAITSDLPEKDQDYDSSRIDWFLQD